MDWSPTEEGRLVTGDCGNCVHVTRAAEGGWATDPVPFVGHVASVEDLQWSPTETTVSMTSLSPQRRRVIRVADVAGTFWLAGHASAMLMFA